MNAIATRARESFADAGRVAEWESAAKVALQREGDESALVV